MSERQRVETTYADLRESDLVIDKAGNAWPIADLETSPVSGSEIWQKTFWLCDPATKVKQHWMLKFYTDAVTVSRVPSHADEAAKLEAEFPPMRHAEDMPGIDLSDDAPSFQEQLKAIVADPEPEVEYTAQEFDAAAVATEDAPVSLPSFGSMTPLEQRSHLFLLHGVLAYDLKSRDELTAMHVDAHRQHAEGKLKSKHVPHVHEAA